MYKVRIYGKEQSVLHGGLRAGSVAWLRNAVETGMWTYIKGKDVLFRKEDYCTQKSCKVLFF